MPWRVRLANDGGTVVLVDLDLAAVKGAADEIRTTCRGDVHAFQVDVTDSAEVARLFLDAEESLGGLDGLVNAAGGISQALDVEDIDDEEWRRVVDANLFGTFLCCRVAFPIMKRGGGGRIVNVSSEAARLPLWPTAAHYVAAKAGVIGLTKHLALEGGPFNINVNVAAPGVTLTEKTRAYYSARTCSGVAGMTPVRGGLQRSTSRWVQFFSCCPKRRHTSQGSCWM